MRLIDLVGKRFGKLVVIKKYGHKYENITWLCQCDCGKKKITIG